MKRIAILFLSCCALMACKRIDVDFSYSPTAPKAGETVTFDNLSTGGEEWSWSFGDGGSSSLKIPTHVYKKPGTYTVTLMVDNKSSRSRTREITIYDTIPSFEISDTTLSIYHDYTLRALVYNPYNYPVSYEWVFPANTIYVAPSDSTQSLSAASYKLYFTQAMTEAPVWLRVILNGDTTLVKKSFNVSDYHTNSVLFRTSSGDYRQRIFGKRTEMFPMPDPSARTALDTEQDTLQNYNGKTFRLSELQTTFPELQGFKIVNRKVYFRDSEGLWVAMLDGSALVQIDRTPCLALTADMTDNRIYWATSEGVKYLPFIGSDNNHYTTTPQWLNRLQGVTKISTEK